MWQLLKKIFVVLVLLTCVLFSWGAWQVGRQGLSDAEWRENFADKVSFDDRGIATVEASSWLEAIEIQGFVTAAERLWQMDLVRRRSAGRLAEWFGEKALDIDTKQRVLGFENVAASNAKSLPPDEKLICDAYAKGVNRFITNFVGRWGLEYQILGQQPEPWGCRDSILVMLSMVESMTSQVKHDKQQSQWRHLISDHWANIIFTNRHPWNRPLFPAPDVGLDEAAPIPQSLPPIEPDELKVTSIVSEPVYAGSNNWAYRGVNGHYLANDPHLNRRVPQTWYAMKLFIRTNAWVVGAALPGLPGIVLGMNSHLAWAFTNTGEDIDDLLILQQGSDSESYQYQNIGGKLVSGRLRTRKEAILVRGREAPVEISVKESDLGPVVELRGNGTLLVRRWLALQPKALGLPVLKMNQATDWASVNQALDRMKLPAQNVLVMQRDGGMGYRVAGTGLERVGTGRWAKKPSESNWVRILPASTRPRLYLSAAEKNRPLVLATANQRVWVDAAGHSWAADDRVDRIRAVLEKSTNLGLEDMQRLQLDSRSKFLLALRDFILLSGDFSADRVQAKIANEWQAWDGIGASNGRVFDDLQKADRDLSNLLLARLLEVFPPKQKTTLAYSNFMRRAWLTRFLQEPKFRNSFGMSNSSIAAWLMGRVQEYRLKYPRPYSQRNRWQVHHPFYRRIPVLGSLFRVREPDQHAGKNSVRVETPTNGASLRFIWDLGAPRNSLWSFPVGQSGHIRSINYRSWQLDFAAGKARAVFSAAEFKKFGL